MATSLNSASKASTPGAFKMSRVLCNVQFIFLLFSLFSFEKPFSYRQGEICNIIIIIIVEEKERQDRRCKSQSWRAWWFGQFPVLPGFTVGELWGWRWPPRQRLSRQTQTGPGDNKKPQLDSQKQQKGKPTVSFFGLNLVKMPNKERLQKQSSYLPTF